MTHHLRDISPKNPCPESNLKKNFRQMSLIEGQSKKYLSSTAQNYHGYQKSGLRNFVRSLGNMMSKHNMVNGWDPRWDPGKETRP